MAEAVYLLGTLTSVLCAVLLLRTYRQSRTRLLLWSSLCFLGLAANNLLLLVDLYAIGPQISLAALRSSVALLSFVLLLFGLLWDAR